MGGRSASHRTLAARTLTLISGMAKDTALVANVQLCAIQMSVKALGDLIKVDPDAIAKPPESLESTAQFPWMCVPSRLAQPSRPSS